MANPEYPTSEAPEQGLSESIPNIPVQHQEREIERQSYLNILKSNDALRDNEIVKEILSGQKRHIFQKIIDHFEKDQNNYARQNFNGKTFDQLNASEQEECFVRYFKEKTKEEIAEIHKENTGRIHNTTNTFITQRSPHAQKRISRQQFDNQDNSASSVSSATGIEQPAYANKQKGEYDLPPEDKEKLQHTFGTDDTGEIFHQINQTQNQQEKKEKIKQLSDIVEIPYEEVRTAAAAQEAQQKKVDKEAQLTTAVVDHLSNKQVMTIAQAKTEEEQKTAFAEAYVENIENDPELKDMACDLVLLTDEANSPEYAAFNTILAEEYVEDRFDLAEKGDISSFSYFPDGSFSYVQKAPENYDSNYYIFVKDGSMTIKTMGKEKNPEAYTRKLDYIPSKEEYQDTLDDLESVKIFDDFKFPQMFLTLDTARDRDMFVRGILGGITEDKSKDLHRLSDDVTTIDHMLRILTGLKRSDMLISLQQQEKSSTVTNRLAELGVWNSGGKPMINIDRLLSITNQIKTHPEIFTSDPVSPEDWDFEKTKNIFNGDEQ